MYLLGKPQFMSEKVNKINSIRIDYKIKETIILSLEFKISHTDDPNKC